MGTDDTRRLMRLAFIDDEPWALLGIRDIIPWKDYGFECAYTFGTAEDAYETLSVDPVDAIITDIRLPEMSGLDLAGRLLRESLVRVAVIVSAYRDFEYAKRAIEESVMYYLLKPLDKAEVCRVAEMMYRRLKAEEAPSPSGSPLRSGDMAERQDHASAGVNCYAFLEGTAVPLSQAVWQGTGGPAFPSIRLVSFKHPLAEDKLRSGISCRHVNFDDIQQMADEAWVSRSLNFHYCSNSTVSRIQYYIATNYSKKLKNQEIAQLFYMSEVYMSERFKKHTGRTIGSFIIDIRIRQATRLLTETEMTIAEISESVGYGDASYFGRLFRKRMGVSPEQYRRKE